MPAITVTENKNGLDASLYVGWCWAPIKGNPAQAYGELYPLDGWFIEQAMQMFQLRKAALFAQADAIRQWVIDYGATVSCAAGSLVMKW